jgi:hypothetical protein
MRLRVALAAALIVTGSAPFVQSGAQQAAANPEFPAELRGQIDDMYKRSVLSPPMSDKATCGTVVAGQEGNWAAPAPWKRTFSHHPSEWQWTKLYPAGTNFRFCQYTATAAGGTRPEVTYTTEVITLNPTPAQLINWMSNACRTAIQLNNGPTNRFDQCVRGLYWGLPMSAPEDKKTKPGLRSVAGGQFVVAGAVVQHVNRGGIICYRDGVAMFRDRPGLPMVGYFAMTETPDGKTEKVVNDGELAECFKIAAPKEWPGGSPVMPSGTTRDQFWSALPKLGKSPSDYGLTARSDLEPSEIWRRVSREAHIQAMKSDRHVMMDAWALANAADLLR